MQMQHSNWLNYMYSYTISAIIGVAGGRPQNRGFFLFLLNLEVFFLMHESCFIMIFTKTLRLFALNLYE